MGISAGNSEVDGGRMLAEARAIAFPRYPGTDGDRRAIEIVAGRFRDAGLEVAEEEFSYSVAPAFRVIRVVLISSALLIGAAGVLALRSVPLAVLLLLLSVLPGSAVLAWTPWAENLYRRPGRTRTANVIGRRPARSTAPAPRLTLILMAHHDSKSQNLTFPWRMGLTLVSILGVVGLAALLVLALAALPSGPAWLPAVTGGTAAVALAILSTLSNGNRSPGGVDNAGSLAILFELARSLPVKVPEDVELIFLSTGAEEDHMVGAMRWLDEHLIELGGRPVYALNFDGAGSPGRAVLIERYGFGKAFAKALADTTAGVAGDLAIPLRRIWLPPAIGIDAIPFDHRGVPCLTFSSGSLGRATIAVHSAGDVADNLDQETLAGVARLARAVVLKLAHSDLR